MRQLIVLAGFILLTSAIARADNPMPPSEARIAQLTDALIAGDVSAAHDMSSSFLARKLSFYAFQGMMESGGIFAEAGHFTFDTTLHEGVEISVTGHFVPENGDAPRPVRFTWLSEDGVWRLHRFGF